MTLLLSSTLAGDIRVASSHSSPDCLYTPLTLTTSVQAVLRQDSSGQKDPSQFPLPLPWTFPPFDYFNSLLTDTVAPACPPFHPTNSQRITRVTLLDLP